MKAEYEFTEDLKREAQKRPKVIDLFSGVGGLSLGLEQAGFHILVDVEIEEIAGRYAQYNAPLTKVLYGDSDGDVKKFSKDTSRVLNLPKDEIALIAGGPPCQGFSLAGKQMVDDPLNDLVLEYARIVDEFKPLSFLMENVPGITTAGSERLAKAIKLLSKDYEVEVPTKLNAWDYGVPQSRQRVFLLGIRKDLETKPSLPLPSHVRPNGTQQTFLPSTPTCWEAISDLPDVDLYPELISGDRIAYSQPPQNDYQRNLREVHSDLDDLSIKPKWDERQCTNLRRTQHGESLLQRFENLMFGENDPTSGIRRLDPSEISTTIRAGTTKDRGSWSAPRPLHPYYNRVLTTRECARIQSFPDWIEFHPSKWHGNRMVGNAVPPLLARAIGVHILKLLRISPPRHIQAQVLRDYTLIEADLKKAHESNYENRKVSQWVSPWSLKNKAGANAG